MKPAGAISSSRRSSRHVVGGATLVISVALVDQEIERHRHPLRIGADRLVDVRGVEEVARPRG
jgi:hypothetical protein